MTFLKNIYHYILAALGAALYGFPSKKLLVIGVTGTKGKSTTVELLSFIFERAGMKTACISSVRVKIGNHVEKNQTDNSMPGRFFLQSFLRRAVRSGCTVALIEVTSQGISQHRHRFIDFNAALFLNLHPEHIEAHGSFENYREAKLKFFRDLARRSQKKMKQFFINEEDSSADYFFDAIHAHVSVCGHTRGIHTSDERGEKKICTAELHYFGRDQFIQTRLMGGRVSIGDWLSNNFNLENAAAASAVLEANGVSWDVVRDGLRAFPGIPGRMEIVHDEPFHFIVDYAHTPDSLQFVYQALRERYFRGRTSRKKKRSSLLCILGSAGGGRDKWKRPEMGKIAATYCDTVILTNEDPYDEPPEEILDQIAAGFAQGGVTGGTGKIYMEVVDRREAIRKAITLARAGDVIVATGKGSEAWIHVAQDKLIPWNERRVAEEELQNAKQ